MRKMISWYWGQVLVLMILTVLLGIGSVFAGVIKKTFEVGAGTAFPKSNMRTFNIPCNTPVTASVKFKRLGSDGESNDVKLQIDLREPDTSSNQEGPVVETKEVTAKKTEQTTGFRPIGSKRGCDLPWRVRVRSENSLAVAVTGEITLIFFDDVRTIKVADVSSSFLPKNDSQTRNFGTSAGLSQGKIEITGTWLCFEGLTICYDPIKLKFELIDPSGRVVATQTGYSGNEVRSDLPKLVLKYNVDECSPGQWKLRITNIGERSANRLRFAAKLKPDCP